MDKSQNRRIVNDYIIYEPPPTMKPMQESIKSAVKSHYRFVDPYLLKPNPLDSISRLLTPTQPHTCWSSKDVINLAVINCDHVTQLQKHLMSLFLSIFLTLLWLVSFVSTIGCLATNMIVAGCGLTDRPSQICNYWVKSSKYWSAGVTCSQQSAGQNHLGVTSHWWLFKGPRNLKFNM